MDSLTQIVLGASVGEAVLGKKVGNKAMLWGAIAGTVPDLDVIARSFVDIVTANEWHRGFSHSIVFCVLMAPLMGWLAHKIHSKESAIWKEWSKLMFWSLFTHPLLDAHTTWGTQLFWPFEYRIAYQNIFVADPMYTIPFLVLVAAAMFYKRTNPTRTKLNNLGLYISSAYMLLTIVFKAVTFKKFENNLEQNHIDYINMDTKPTPLNSILWTANVETNDEFLIGYYSLLDEDDNIEWGHYKKNHELLGDLANNDKVKRLIAISQSNYIITKDNKGNLYFNDLRFGQAGLDAMNSNFIFQYLLKPNGNDVEVSETPKTMKEGGEILKQLSERIGGNK